jgi:hypothetical protein
MSAQNVVYMSRNGAMLMVDDYTVRRQFMQLDVSTSRDKSELELV